MPHQPLFSVVIPAYNAEKTVAAAIESALMQGDDLEVIVMDDGSTDNTRAACEAIAVRNSRLRVYSQANAGSGAAIGAAIERSMGCFIVQLGADDELLPEYAAETRSFIEHNPGYDIYASNAYRLLPDGSHVIYHAEPRFREVFSLTVDDLIDESQIYVTAAFRREWYERVGGFRTEFHNEDYDFWLRMMLAGAKHIYNPIPLALYRVVPGQKTEDAIRMRTEDIRILEDAIARGLFTAEETEHARRTIRMLERNISFRHSVARIVPCPVAEAVFRVAHRFAWLWRPYRRRRA